MSGEGCLACELTTGARELPGGRVFATAHWVVEHCVGPLGVGTLLVKPFRHCIHVSALDAEEAAELGPLLVRTAACVGALTEPSQVYVCLWSHAGWSPGHIHFVVQPVPAGASTRHTAPGPTLQSEQFRANEVLPAAEVESFCDRARRWDGWLAP